MMQKCKTYIIWLWLIICCFACDAFCETPAGTVISNFAIATFYDTETGVGGQIVSNEGIITVTPVYALQLMKSQHKEAVPGGFINFPHILKNTGNSEDSYQLTVSNFKGDDFDAELIQIILDQNNNGQIDPGESAISQTGVIAPDDFIHLVIGMSVPGGLKNESSANIAVSARSLSAERISDENIDTVIITIGALIRIGMTHNPNCDEYVESTENIHFSINFTNVGFADPDERDIPILKNDAITPQKGVLIESNIPPNTFLDAEKEINIAPVNALLLVKPILTATNHWIPFDDWNGQDFVEKIGLLITDNGLTTNTSGRLAYYLQVAENITNGIMITNIAGIDIDGDGTYEFESNETCNRIRSKDSAQINFIDSSHTYVQSYQLESSPKYEPAKDDVYLEVKSSSFNRFVYEKDVIQATIESKETSDSIQINLYETDLNTGIFRSKTPIILVDEDQGRKRAKRICMDDTPCFLFSKPIDSLISIIEDPVEGELRDLAAIEPFGHVFDSISLEPIQGAQVTILRLDNEPTTDTNGNPIVEEVTNSEGRFQFTNVAPYDGYYFSVLPPSDNYAFPSEKPPGMMAYAWPDVSQTSYGKDGYKNQVPLSGLFSIGSSNKALQVDIPIDLVSSGEILEITKTIKETYTYIGSIINYEVKVKNRSNVILINAKLYDWLPEGFVYKSATTFIDGVAADNPTNGDDVDHQYENQKPDLVFLVGKLESKQEVVIQYALIVSEDTPPGLKTNTAQAEATSGGAAIIRSNYSPAEINVRQGLVIQKSIRQEVVNINNQLRYTIKIANRSGSDLKDAEIVDTPPKGFEYVTGSSQIDGLIANEPINQINALNNQAELIFHIGNLNIDEEKVLTYDLKVTKDAILGDGNNIAKATARFEDDNIIKANPSQAKVEIVPGILALEKSANVSTAMVGDIIFYTIKVRNNHFEDLKRSTIVDQLPFGFKYVNDSAAILINTNKVPFSLKTDNAVIFFHVNDFNYDDQLTLTYAARVTPGGLDGNGINTAYITATTATDKIINSPVSKVQVEIKQQGIFSDKAIVFGKLYMDSDCDAQQTYQEWPVGGVKLFLEDGTWVISDENGQFSLYGLEPGLHVIKMDATTIPKGLSLKLIDIDQAADPYSRFIDLSEGDFHRADFAFFCPCQNKERVINELKARNDHIRGDWMLEEALNQKIQTSSDTQRNQKPGTDGDISMGQAYPKKELDIWQKPATENSIQENSETSTSDEPVNLTIAQPTKAEKQTGIGPSTKVSTAAQNITKEMAQKGAWIWPEGEIVRDNKFIVGVISDIVPELVVNDVNLKAAHLGEQVENSSQRAQVLAYYGVKLVPGKNDIRIEGKDMFGNRRVLAQKAVLFPGTGKTLTILPETNTLAADGGKSILPINIQIKDANNLPASGIYFVTIEATDGTFVETDIQDNTPGHQFRLKDGQAVIHLRSSDKTGSVTIKASSDTKMKDETVIHFIQPTRSLIAVGLVDLGLNYNNLSTDQIKPSRSDDLFDEKLNVTQKFAVYLKGKIKGDILLTLAYDSKKDDDTSLFRDIDPNAYYPIYGDASIKGFDAQSTGKLYVKLEKGKSSIMWGDFETDTNRNERLNRFQMVLNGANARYETDKTLATAFVSQSDYHIATEELRANGTATYYRIEGHPIEPHSERIEIITRSRDNSGIIVDSKKLNRFDHYVIDAFSGHITFYEVIPSYDMDNNPKYIRITYTSQKEVDSYLILGTRISHQFFSGLKLGAAWSLDDHPEDGNSCESFFADYRLNKHHMIIDMAHMSHKTSETEDGIATKVKVNSKWNQYVDSNIQYIRAQEGFVGKHSSITPGKQDLKTVFNIYPFKKYSFKGELLHSENLIGDNKSESAMFSIIRKSDKWTTELGYRHIRQHNTADNDDIETIRARADYRFLLFNKSGEIYTELEQDVAESDRHSYKLGTRYEIYQKTKFYSEYEHINSLSGINSLSSDISKSNTKFGITTSLLPSTETYAEHRIRGGIDGREMQSISGIRNTFNIKKGLSISPNAEYIYTHEGSDTGGAFSFSLGILDKRSKNSKSSARFETRLQSKNDYYRFKASHATRLNVDWTTLIHEDISIEDYKDQDDKLRQALSLGAAYRPRLNNTYHFLGLYKYIEEKNINEIAKRNVHIFSSHHNYQLNRQVLLSGRLATKFQVEKNDNLSFHSSTQLLGFRALWQILPRWGLDLRAGSLMNDFDDSIRYSAGIGANYLIRKNLRFALGYNLQGFNDKDLDKERYYAQGVRLGVQWKFDESLFGILDFLFDKTKKNKKAKVR